MKQHKLPKYDERHLPENLFVQINITYFFKRAINHSSEYVGIKNYASDVC